MSGVKGDEELLARDTQKKGFAGSFQKHTHNIAIWGGFLTLSLVVYFLLSSGDFSFLLTYAAFMRCFGLGLLNFKMLTSRSAKGVSMKTLQIYILVFVSRLISILRHQGYLPFDKSGDWFYHFVEFVSLASTAVALYGTVVLFKNTYDEKYDRFGNLHVPSQFGAAYLIVPCIVLAIFFHPDLNREWLADFSWTLSMYLEASAMLPQIYMFQKQAVTEGGAVEALIGHTVFALGFSRIFELWFWLSSFKELSNNAGSRLPGYVVLISQFIHLIIMGDFFYYYFKSLSQGIPMELPSSRYDALV